MGRLKLSSGAEILDVKCTRKPWRDPSSRHEAYDCDIWAGKVGRRHLRPTFGSISRGETSRGRPVWTALTYRLKCTFGKSSRSARLTISGEPGTVPATRWWFDPRKNWGKCHGITKPKHVEGREQITGQFLLLEHGASAWEMTENTQRKNNGVDLFAKGISFNRNEKVQSFASVNIQETDKWNWIPYCRYGIVL